MDYSLCDETVTIYRKTETEIIRVVLENARLIRKTLAPTESYGKSLEKKFWLIIPADFPLLLGDRVFAGTGPQVTDWKKFIPALVEELYEIGFVKPCYWDGELIHWEAGNGKETL